MKARIELKTSKEVKDLIKRASEISGVSLTEFILTNLVEKATEIISDENSDKENSLAFKEIQNLLENPPKATEALKELLRG